MGVSEQADRQWMSLALEQASLAFDQGEVPVGAVIVRDGQLIASAHNEREQSHSALAHAECLAIQRANLALGGWRLEGCTLYVTLEPCLMCAGAIYQARLPRVCFGSLDPKAGALGSLFRLHEDQRLNHRYICDGGLLAEESSELLRSFFRMRRKKTEG